MSDIHTTVDGAAPAAPPTVAPPRSSRLKPVLHRGKAPLWVALLWLAPALVLILGVVVYPAFRLLEASFNKYAITGFLKGSAGFDNYIAVINHPALPKVLSNTAIWVVSVVVITIVVGLALAQLMAAKFPGRRILRWAVIVPWAASLIITARLFTLLLDYDHGIINQLLVDVHILNEPIDFLGDSRWTMISIIAVGVFVSLPFNAYVFLAGLNGIPEDLYEAARIDGASPWQIYRSITLPLLRPALFVATVLSIIYVFNSFPIVYTLNDSNPGYGNDTTITFMYKLAFKSFEHSVGMSAAMGVLNVLLILVVVAVYLRFTNWREQAKA